MGKKKVTAAKINPFNLKVNRQKHNILGQKVLGSHGNPIRSHGLVQLKRKAMFKKMTNGPKANSFLDSRFVDMSSSKEDTTTLRLVEHRQRKFKKSIFNLNDEESLTHHGQSLDHIEDFKDRGCESDDEEPLTATYVTKAHFGGFTTDEGETNRREIVSQLISENKQKKQEKKDEKQFNIDLTEKLDAEWKNLHATIGRGKKIDVLQSNDPYDIAFHELTFESRAAPTTRLISPEEIAWKENEKRKHLESEMFRRMVDNQDISLAANNHLSADSIFDGIILEKVNPNDVKQASDNDEDVESEGYQSDFSDKISKEDNSIPSVKLLELQELLNLENDNCSEKVESVINGGIVNRQNVADVFEILLLQLVKCKKVLKSKEIITMIFPHLYTLAERSPIETAHSILKLLDVEQSLFQKYKGCKRVPIRFETLVLLNLCGYLYSTSDFRHPVITPAMLFISDILFSKMGNLSHNLIAKLFLSRLCLKWVAFSKRIFPEVICFLNNVLKQVLRGKPKNVPNSSLQINLFSIAETNDFSVDNVTLLIAAVEQLCGFIDIYSKVPSFSEIFHGTLTLCERLSQHYPSTVVNLVEKINMNRLLVLQYISFPYSKPKPLKLFEPYFESKFTTENENKRKGKLLTRISQKIRKEERGLLREIRQDSRILASERLKQQLAADEQRKQKVKQIYHDLASQEGEYKKMMKKK